MLDRLEEQVTRNRLFPTMLALTFCFQPIARADEHLKTGNSAPPLSFKQLLQARAGVRGTWEELKGQAVVLEFWATWCGGCVDNIPHINELAAEFKSKPIQFISITDETDLDLVKHFLTRHPISGWVAFDDENSTFKRYGVEGRPQTVLVNRSGVVEGITNIPRSVTPQVLNDLLEGAPLHFPEVPLAPPMGSEPGAPAPLLQVMIRPAAPVAISGTSPGLALDQNGRHEEYGVTLLSLLSEIRDVPENLIDAPEWCSGMRYDVSIVTPQHQEALRGPLLIQMVEAVFQLKVHTETKPTRVYVLTRLDGQKPNLRVSSSKEESAYWIRDKGEAQLTGASVDSIVRIARFVLGLQVVDETRLTGRYDFDLKYDPSHPETLAQMVRDQLGLNLAEGQRNLVHLVVDSATEPKTW